MTTTAAAAAATTTTKRRQQSQKQQQQRRRTQQCHLPNDNHDDDDYYEDADGFGGEEVTGEHQQHHHHQQAPLTSSSLSSSSSSVAPSTSQPSSRKQRNPQHGSAAKQQSKTTTKVVRRQPKPPPSMQEQQQNQSQPLPLPLLSPSISMSSSLSKVRHSGRAQIRGRIRRIWRPRYLELYDSGLLRYHELPSTADTTTTSSSSAAAASSIFDASSSSVAASSVRCSAGVGAWPSSSSAAIAAQQAGRQQRNSTATTTTTTAAATSLMMMRRIQDQHHVHMIPKYALVVYDARILDVTTFRDMHAGLPAGTYGFLFRGQRLEQQSQQQTTPQQQYRHSSSSSATTHRSSNSTQNNNSTSTTTTATSAHQDHHQQPSAQQRHESHQQRQRRQPTQQQYHGDNNSRRASLPSSSATAPANVDPSLSSSSQMTMMASALSLPPLQPQDSKMSEQRDYLCAVSSLEEAQMWVVALQWAADQHRQRGRRISRKKNKHHHKYQNQQQPSSSSSSERLSLSRGVSRSGSNAGDNAAGGAATPVIASVSSEPRWNFVVHSAESGDDGEDDDDIVQVGEGDREGSGNDNDNDEFVPRGSGHSHGTVAAAAVSRRQRRLTYPAERSISSTTTATAILANTGGTSRDARSVVGPSVATTTTITTSEDLRRHSASSPAPSSGDYDNNDNVTTGCFERADHVASMPSSATLSRTMAATSSSFQGRGVDGEFGPPGSKWGHVGISGAGAGGGRMVVSKVVQYKMLRLLGGALLPKYEIAYEIHGLLLFSSFHNHNQSQQHHSAQTTAASTQPQSVAVEEWSILRTADDLLHLATMLSKELGSAATSERMPLDAIRQLPRICASCKIRGKNRGKYQDGEVKIDEENDDDDVDEDDILQRLSESLMIVDEIVRNLVMDARSVNTVAMKNFLGLSTKSKDSNKAGGATSTWLSTASRLLWNVHDPTSTIERKATTTFRDHVGTEMFVKKWLKRKQQLQQQQRSVGGGSGGNAARSSSYSSRCERWVITTLLQGQRRHRRRWHSSTTCSIVMLGGLTTVVAIPITLWMSSAAGIGLPFFQHEGSQGFVGYPPTFTSSSSSSLQLVTMRLDHLVLSWAGAACLGYLCATATSSTTTTSGSNSRKKGVRGTISSSSKPKLVAPSSASSNVRRLKRIVSDQDMYHGNADSSTTEIGVPSSLVESEERTGGPAVEHRRDEMSTSRSGSENVIIEERQPILVSGGHAIADDVGLGGQGEEEEEEESDGEVTTMKDNVSDAAAPSDDANDSLLSSPLPKYSANNGCSCWSQPPSNIFHVRGANYFNDRVKIKSDPAPLKCRGVDVWLTDNPERNISRHPAVLGGKLNDVDTFLVNFLLPFGNFVSYFAIPPLNEFPEKLRDVWVRFLRGDQAYRDARLKLLPVVMDGPWIVKAAVGPGKSPALLGKVIPLQYYFRDPADGGDAGSKARRKGVYEVDVLISASSIAKGILSVVKGHTSAITIGFAFIIEAATVEELPETVLCSFQVHSLHLDDCPHLPPFPRDEEEEVEDEEEDDEEEEEATDDSD